MVGLVVVCHSRPLASAAVALAAEMVQDKPVRVEVAAGLDETTFGTDAVAIMEAITAAEQGDGVVVLMDLGSAVLSAELALELLDDDQRAGVLLCPAPLVEGLVAAVVAAATGAARAEVAAEATAALAGKQSHLGSPETPDPVPRTPESGPAVTITVSNPHGLHARPAARLVTAVKAFDAKVELRNASTGSAWVPAASLSRVATLGALHGHQLEARASGPQAEAALDHLVALAGQAFGERPDPEPEPTPAAAGNHGLGASAGIGVGRTFRLRAARNAELPPEASRGETVEWNRVERALEDVGKEVRRLRAATAREVGDEAAGIFDAHLLLLEDEELLSEVRRLIGAGAAAPQAVQAAGERIGSAFAGLQDAYLRARADDVRAVTDQLLQALHPNPNPNPSLDHRLGSSPSPDHRPGPSPGPGYRPGPSPGHLPDPSPGLGGAGSGEVERRGVLVAAELSPAEAAGLDPGRVAGVLLAFGSPTAHGAILARARGVPAVVGLGAAVLGVADGTTVALDGGTGEVVFDPAPEVLAEFRQRAGAQAVARQRAVARAAGPAVTKDGTRIEVGANVGSVADARAAFQNGADLAGLVRTEFLFLGRDDAPGLDEQVAVYSEIAAAFGGRRITLRTLDVGGDKPLPYAGGPAEDNPFLGVRGIRHSFAHPGLLTQQLAAIVRVARQAPVSVMFPMVSTLSELVRVRALLDEAAGGDLPGGLQIGIMVEVPAAALKAASFVPHVDFFSIGTNDLTQYTLAAERGNPELATLADGLDPTVLRLIDGVCRAAGERVTVSVCGELAADETTATVLTGLGVRELSVTPRMVPAVKEAIRAAHLDQSRTTAQAALNQPDAAAVRALLAHD